MTSEQLFYDKKTGFDKLTGSDKRNMTAYAEEYKKFLDEAKTERDAVKEMVRLAEEKGFRAWTRNGHHAFGDRQKAARGGRTPDCRTSGCAACGYPHGAAL